MATSRKSILGRLRSEHHDLEREIAELRTWWQSRDKTRPPNLGTLSRRVMDVHDRLASHFTEEEEGECLSRAAEIRPEFADDVVGLLDEHRQFRSALTELGDKLARGAFRNKAEEEPWLQFEAILTDLAEHEQHENEILFNAFGEDYREQKEP